MSKLDYYRACSNVFDVALHRGVVLLKPGRCMGNEDVMCWSLRFSREAPEAVVPVGAQWSVAGAESRWTSAVPPDSSNTRLIEMT